MREGETVPAAPSHLVTGGAGFIGCNLVDRLLSDGERVIVLDNLSRPGSRINLDWLTERHADALTVLEGDVCDAGVVASAIESADVVYHLAGQTAVTTSIRDPVADFDINVRGTINVLEAARARDTPPIVIYASTNKVYGDLEDQRIVEESARYVLPIFRTGSGRRPCSTSRRRTRARRERPISTSSPTRRRMDCPPSCSARAASMDRGRWA